MCRHWDEIAVENESLANCCIFLHQKQLKSCLRFQHVRADSFLKKLVRPCDVQHFVFLSVAQSLRCMCDLGNGCVHFYPNLNFFFKMTASMNSTFWYPPLVSTPLSSPPRGATSHRRGRQTRNIWVKSWTKLVSGKPFQIFFSWLMYGHFNMFVKF